jgi:hypothetical protein
MNICIWSAIGIGTLTLLIFSPRLMIWFLSRGGVFNVDRKD